MASHIKSEARQRFLAIIKDFAVGNTVEEVESNIRLEAWEHYKRQYDCCEELFEYRIANMEVFESVNKLPSDVYWFLVGAGLINPDEGNYITK